MQKHGKVMPEYRKTISENESIPPARADGATRPPTTAEDYKKMADKERKVGYSRRVTAQAVEAQLEQLRWWAEIKQDRPWKAAGQTWEEWAEENLGCSYKTVDNALEDRITLGEPLLKLLMEFDVTKAQVRGLCRAVRTEGLQIEGAVIRDGATVINAATDTPRVIDYVERLHTAAEAKKIEAQEARREAKEAKSRLAEHQEAAQKMFANQHALIDKQKAEIRSLRELQPPADLAADADRESWRAARQALGECDLHVSSLAALAADPQRTDVLRARVVGHLRMLQGWIAAAVDEIAEQMPPEWAPTIEAEEQDCAIAPALPREIIEEVRQRTIAKGGLTLVPSVVGDNGHSAEIPTGVTH